MSQNTFFGSNEFWSVTKHPLGSLDFSENAPTVYKYSLICGSRGSLAHNHAGWQRLHGSSVHQKAQICRSDFEICRCISKLQLAQNGKYFLILICNLVLYSKFRGTSLRHSVFFRTSLGKSGNKTVLLFEADDRHP